MPTATFTTAQVAHRAGIPYSTLAQWAAEGLVDVKPPKSKRDGYKWTAKHLREILVMARMREIGVPMQLMRESMGYLRTLGHNPYSTGRFLVLRKGSGRGRNRIDRLVKVCDGGEAIEIIGRHRGQYVLPLWGAST